MEEKMARESQEDKWLYHKNDKDIKGNTQPIEYKESYYRNNEWWRRQYRLKYTTICAQKGL